MERIVMINAYIQDNLYRSLATTAIASNSIGTTV